MVRLRPIESRSVRRTGYDSPRWRLVVQFRSSDAVYVCYNVEPQVFSDLERAESKGRFINYEIKGRYRYRRLGRLTVRREKSG
jgi:hypothetical protein